MNLDFPYAVDARGRTATSDDEEHLRSMISQVLFTTAGERVNRPTFGCGLRELIFDPNSEELAAATELQLHGALQLWLGNLIEVQEVAVRAEDAAFRIVVSYVVRRTQQRRVADVVQPVVAP